MLTGHASSDAQRAEQLLQSLAERHTRYIVAPDDFPYGAQFPAFGIRIPSPLPLYRRLAARLAVSAAEQLGWQPPELHIALHGQSLSSDMVLAAEQLCRHARCLSLCTGRDASTFCLALQRRYGVSVFAHPPAAELQRCRLHLLFDPPDESFSRILASDTRILPLFEESPARARGVAWLSVDLRPPAPFRALFADALPPEPLLAALFAEGQLTTGDFLSGDFRFFSPSFSSGFVETA